MKQIIICFDGTGNSPDKVPTNIYTIFKSLNLNTKITQLPFYFEGVGNSSFKPLRLLSQALGFGVSGKVKEAYKNICKTYSPGDKIFIFGFSRGAFEAHILSEFLLGAGILDRKQIKDEFRFNHLVNSLYFKLKLSHQTIFSKVFLFFNKLFSGAKEKKPILTHKDIEIEFLGLFDCVDATGLFGGFNLSDFINKYIFCYKLKNKIPSKNIKCIRHAISLSEEREAFAPFLFIEGEHENIESRLFAGEHSNIGGGLKREGLSLIPLRWMIEEAEESNLIFNNRDKEIIRIHSNHFDIIYNSRAGLKSYFRWRPRNFIKIFKKYNIWPKIDKTVFLRVYAGLYSPGNLPENGTVKPVNKKFHIDTRPLQNKLKTISLLRNLTYYGFVIFSLLLLYKVAEINIQNDGLQKTLLSLFSPNILQIFIEIIKMPAFIIGAAIFYIAGEIFKIRYRGICYRFWQQNNGEIKKILGL